MDFRTMRNCPMSYLPGTGNHYGVSETDSLLKHAEEQSFGPTLHPGGQGQLPETPNQFNTNTSQQMSLQSPDQANGSGTKQLKLPNLIDALAKEGQVLQWDETHHWFEVLDGPAFEERFNALRCVRGKRREDAVDRPFARMHIHFVLARGDKWAGTGTAFRPKGDSSFVPKGASPEQVSGGPFALQPVVPIVKCEDTTSPQDPHFSGLKRAKMSDGSPESEMSEYASNDDINRDAWGRNNTDGQQDEADEKDVEWLFADNSAGDSAAGAGGAAGGAAGGGSKTAFVRLPDLVDRLAQEGKVLKYDTAREWYEVVDGPGFESRFNALRFKRGKRKEEALHRPFARMHIHFTLVRGDKWAGTGSAFRPKAAVVASAAAAAGPRAAASMTPEDCKAPTRIAGSPASVGGPPPALSDAKLPIAAAPPPAVGVGGLPHHAAAGGGVGMPVYPGQPCRVALPLIPPPFTGILPNGACPAAAPGAIPPAAAGPRPPAPVELSADMIRVNLRNSAAPAGGSGGFQCTLQHFLDVTGAGDLYVQCSMRKDYRTAGVGCGPAIPPPARGEHPHAYGGGGGHEGAYHVAHYEAMHGALRDDGRRGGCAPGGAGMGMMDYGCMSSSDQTSTTESSADGSPDSMFEDDACCDAGGPGGGGGGLISDRDIASIIGTMWHESSLGDQAYFFPRREGSAPLANGAIVAMVDGRLCAPAGVGKGDDPSAVMYMVVSDSNAKWKGEPIPTAQEERLGHWCAFLGQVPVRVDGVVRAGEFIGPAADGSGLGVVARLGEGPVVGIALVGKETEEAGVVRTLCFAGFNALSPVGDAFKTLFAAARRLEETVESLRRGVEKCECGLSAVHADAAARDRHVRELEARLEVVETLAVGTPRGGAGGAAAMDSVVVTPLEAGVAGPAGRTGRGGGVEVRGVGCWQAGGKWSKMQKAGWALTLLIGVAIVSLLGVIAGRLVGNEIDGAGGGIGGNLNAASSVGDLVSQPQHLQTSSAEDRDPLAGGGWWWQPGYYVYVTNSSAVGGQYGRVPAGGAGVGSGGGGSAGSGRGTGESGNASQAGTSDRWPTYSLRP